MFIEFEELFVGGLIIGLIAIVILLFVYGGESKEERQARYARYVSSCEAEGIKRFECDHMWRVEEDVRAAKDSASSAAVMSGVAVGLSAGKR